MSKSNSGADGAFGLTQHPTVWTFAAVIAIALIALALLRHFFGSIKVDFAAGSK